MNFSKKYHPKSESDLIYKEASKIKSFLNNPPKGKLLLLVGPTGVGKTATVLTLAKDFEVLELNAANYRNKSNINSVMGSFCSQMSLFAKKKLVLIDEVDAFSGRHDQGGLQEVLKVLETATVPIIATANKIDEDKMKSLLKKSEILVFSKVSWADITQILEDICTKENISFNDSQLKKIAIASQGDIRAAINDLQSLVSKGTLLDFESVDRDKKKELVQSLVVIFKSLDPLISLSSINNLDEALTGDIPFPIVYSGETALSYWLEENVPLEYNELDTFLAFEKLSKVDILKSRIQKTGYWRLMAYFKDFLGPGVSLSKSSKNMGSNTYKIVFRSPKRNPRLWWMHSTTKKSIAEKLSKKNHTSVKQCFKDVNFLNPVLIENKDFLELESKEVAYLKKNS